MLPFCYSFTLLAQQEVKNVEEKLNVNSSKEQTTAEKKQDVNTEVPQKVEVKAHLDVRRNNTASTIVVNKDEILSYGDSNMGDVLRRLPGVSIPSTTSSSVQISNGRSSRMNAGVGMRGMAGYTNITVNGQAVPPGFSVDALSPESVERIEMVRSAKAELGTQAVAGTINIVLKQGIEIGKNEIKLGVNAENGRIATHANLDWVGKIDFLDKGAFSIPMTYTQNPIYRQFNSYETSSGVNSLDQYERGFSGDVDGKVRILNVLPRLNWISKEGGIFAWVNMFSALKTDFRSRFGTTALKNDSNVFSSFNNVMNMDNTSALSNLTWVTRLDGGAKLEMRAGLRYGHRNSDSQLNGYVNNPVQVNQNIDTLTRNQHVLSREQATTFWGKYTSKFLPDHSLVFGWDASLSKRVEESSQRDVQNSSSSILDDFDVRQNKLALYTQDEWDLSEQASVYAGLRWEGISTQNLNSNTGNFKHQSSVLSPIASVLYRFESNSDDQLRLAIARTYRAPNTYDMIQRRIYSLRNTPSTPDMTGNSVLRPELSWGLDVGVDHYLKVGGLLSANVYYRKIDDVINTVVSQQEQDGRWVSRPQNMSGATSYGLELDAKFPAKLFFQNAPDIEFKSNLSLNYSKVDQVHGPNNRLEAQIPLTANVGFDYKLHRMPMRLGANFNFQQGGQVRLSNQQTLYSTARRNLDLYAVWNFDHLSKLRFSVSNALQQSSIDRANYKDEFREVMKTSQNESHANFRLSFEHRF